MLHPESKALIESIKQDLPQSLLINVPYGFGYDYVVDSIVEGTNYDLFNIRPSYDGKIDDIKGIISVDDIRGIYDLTKSKNTNGVVVFIYDSEKMNHAAQNAFLKLLEEPSAGTHFILLTSRKSELLPTIISRVKSASIKPLTSEQSVEFIKSSGVTDETKIRQLLFMASGLPFELKKLISDPNYFEDRSRVVKDARTFLSGSEYEKLVIINSYKDSRDKALTLITDSMNQIRLSLENNQGQELVQKLDSLLKAHDRIAANGNIRLQLGSVV